MRAEKQRVQLKLRSIDLKNVKAQLPQTMLLSYRRRLDIHLQFDD